jgi:PKD repeat protein
LHCNFKSIFLQILFHFSCKFLEIYFFFSHYHPDQFIRDGPNIVDVNLNQVMHPYEERQSIEMHLEVSDPNGAVGETFIRLRPVGETNVPPVAEFLATPQTGEPNLTVEMSGHLSSDADAGDLSLKSCEWFSK